jgi:hypothetical protein
VISRFLLDHWSGHREFCSTAVVTGDVIEQRPETSVAGTDKSAIDVNLDDRVFGVSPQFEPVE